MYSSMLKHTHTHTTMYYIGNYVAEKVKKKNSVSPIVRQHGGYNP